MPRRSHLRPVPILTAATVIAALSTSLPAQSPPVDASAASSTDVQTVVDKYVARRDAPLGHYRARRRLEAENRRFSKSGWIEVMTERTPDGFDYEVLAEGGSPYVRDKVLLAALEGERDALRTNVVGALDADNYYFLSDGVEGAFARIRAVPMRREKCLVDGWLLVTPDDADLVTVRGRLAKSPSFWTTRVEIERTYERIAGVRVPVRMFSTASVRFAGQSTFLMEYDYESIEGAAVSPGGD